MSSIPGVAQKLTPAYTPNQTPGSESEPPATQSLIRSLGLEPHVEGGYFAEIDRNPWLVPNPFLSSEKGDDDDDEGGKMTASTPLSGDNSKRNASTSIYYMLSAVSPQGCFHRNRGRTVCLCCLFLVFVFLFALCYLHTYLPTYLPHLFSRLFLHLILHS